MLAVAARPSIVRHWTLEVPEEWERALREYSPVSRVVPWLALRWFPLRKKAVGRWVLSECVAEELIAEKDRDIVTILQGPKPSTLPPNMRAVVESFVNDYQWSMYRTHRVWARELWILQGTNGGHATAYSPQEQDVLRLCGLPTDPPAVGALPYAPFDQRVIARMRERNRLTKLGNNLDTLRKSGAREVMITEEAEAAKAFRRQYVAFLEEQQRDRVELTTWFTSKSDNRDSLPTATAAEVRAAAMAKDYYIETGELPTVPLHAA